MAVKKWALTVREAAIAKSRRKRVDLDSLSFNLALFFSFSSPLLCRRNSIKKYNAGIKNTVPNSCGRDARYLETEANFHIPVQTNASGPIYTRYLLLERDLKAQANMATIANTWMIEK